MSAARTSYEKASRYVAHALHPQNLPRPPSPPPQAAHGLAPQARPPTRAAGAPTDPPAAGGAHGHGHGHGHAHPLWLAKVKPGSAPVASAIQAASRQPRFSAHPQMKFVQ